MKFNDRTEDMTGRRFGKLTALAYDGLWKLGVATSGSAWLCLCDCGKPKRVRASYLREGRARSCGCLKGDVIRARIQAEGRQVAEEDKPLYKLWQSVKTRCLNTKHPTYKNYGGRGIGISQELAGSFRAFKAAVGPRPSEQHSIDRIDNARGYETGNLRWATRSEQASNTRRTILVDWGGEKVVLIAVCRKENVNYADTYHRIMKLGLPIEEVVQQVRAKGSVFLERATQFGGNNAIRKTTRTRASRNNQNSKEILSGLRNQEANPVPTPGEFHPQTDRDTL